MGIGVNDFSVVLIDCERAISFSPFQDSVPDFFRMEKLSLEFDILMIFGRIKTLIEIFGLRGKNGFSIQIDDRFFKHIISRIALAQNCAGQMIDRQINTGDAAEFTFQIVNRNGTRNGKTGNRIHIHVGFPQTALV